MVIHFNRCLPKKLQVHLGSARQEWTMEKMVMNDQSFAAGMYVCLVNPLVVFQCLLWLCCGKRNYFKNQNSSWCFHPRKH